MTFGPARLRRSLLAVLVTAAVAAPLSAAGQPSTPAPAPLHLPAVAAHTLDTRYAANRDYIAEAARVAERYGDSDRAHRLEAMAVSGRHFLTFDGRGSGRAVEVFGSLAGAERIVVVVPGSDTTLDTYDAYGSKPYSSALGGGAGSLYGELRRQDPNARVAVVAWLGYDAPQMLSTDVLTTGRAEDGARALRGFVHALQRVNREAKVSVLCHSYGSVVCGRAASGLTDTTDIAVFGSPGLGVGRAADLGTRARVWAGRGAGDWISDVPHVRLGLLGTTVGFGADPAEAGFGARTFAAGGGGHGDYLKPGSVALRNLALIAAGRGWEASHG
ncbi:alpha/beta hydrolase [Streptomyces sp. NPDC002521]